MAEKDKFRFCFRCGTKIFSDARKLRSEFDRIFPDASWQGMDNHTLHRVLEKAGGKIK
jgi:hypothetical protein